MVVVGSFLTVATIFNFIEDCVRKPKPTTDSNTISSSKEVDSNVDSTGANLTVNIPIDDADSERHSLTLHSNSDNDDYDSSESMETKALLVPG